MTMSPSTTTGTTPSTSTEHQATTGDHAFAGDHGPAETWDAWTLDLYLEFHSTPNTPAGSAR